MKRLMIGAGLGGALVGAWAGLQGSDETRLTFLAVGQGDCAVLQHGGRTLLVDAGPAGESWDSAKAIILPRLRRLGVQRVDLIVLTHPDLDHVGGTGTLLKAFPGAKLVASATYRTDPEMQAHLARWKMNPDQVTWVEDKSELRIGSLPILLYAPEVEPGSESNDGSLFVRIGPPPGSALLTGDAPWEEELQALRQADWRASILKAGHHGSGGSSAESFLQAVRAEWLVVSCGRDNRYGHPSPAVLNRADRRGMRVARTDREGDLTFVMRDGRFVRSR
jgi:competence protein ComEC